MVAAIFFFTSLICNTGSISADGIDLVFFLPKKPKKKKKWGKKGYRGYTHFQLRIFFFHFFYFYFIAPPFMYVSFTEGTCFFLFFYFYPFWESFFSPTFTSYKVFFYVCHPFQSVSNDVRIAFSFSSGVKSCKTELRNVFFPSYRTFLAFGWHERFMTCNSSSHD